eukprot:476932_1
METGEWERGIAEEVPPNKKRLNAVLFFILVCCALRFFIPNRTGDVHAGLELESKRLNRFTGANDTRISVNVPPLSHTCTFLPGQRMSLRVYLCPEETCMDEFPLPADRLIWAEDGLIFDSRPGNARKKELRLTVNSQIPRNGSVWAHIYLVKNGAVLWKSEEGYSARDVVFKSHQLNVRRGYNHREKSLKQNDNSTHTSISSDYAFENFWKPTLALNLLDMYKPYPHVPNETLHEYAGYMEFHKPSGDYYPIIFPNEFSLFMKDLIPLNETVFEVPLTVSWNMMGLLKFNVIRALNGEGKKNLEDCDSDKTMENFLNHPLVLVLYKAWATNPFGVAAPIFIIALVHMIFDFFALKNDISFWRNNNHPSGLSVHSICVNCVYESIIIFHLWDMGTTWIVLVGNVAYLITEIWKIGKAMSVSLQWCPSTIPLPYLSFKYLDSYKHSASREYDEIANMHQVFIAVPLLLGYSAFSLLYMKHKNWQSWILHSLVSFVYMFGFINMTPQVDDMYIISLI